MDHDFDISEYHDLVLEFLLERRKKDVAFKFSLRRSNNSSRLSQGFWFYGNDHYLAVSFWSGFDYANRTPNLYFIVGSNGTCAFEIVARDSEDKAILLDLLTKDSRLPDFEPRGYKRYRITFPEMEIENALNYFLDKLRPTIDLIIDDWHLQGEKTVEKESQLYDEIEYRNSLIGEIDEVDFEKTLQNVLRYRDRQFAELKSRPAVGLKDLEVHHFGPIRELKLYLPSSKPQFVFLTGENGGGKTSILKAIATAVTADKSWYKEYDFYIQCNLFINKQRKKRAFSRDRRGSSVSNDLQYRGFLAYGPIRLFTKKPENTEFAKSVDHQRFVRNLFNETEPLYDMYEMEWLWTKARVGGKRPKLDIKIMRETLVSLIGENIQVVFPSDDKNSEVGLRKETTYLELDENGMPYQKLGVAFSELASGLKSMVALFGDMIVKLASQQPEVVDVSEFRGIVLIDEIDIHLHPKLQKAIVEKLSKTFPRIQFIVTTHSPIPMLGAPKDSIFIRVEKDWEQGVRAEIMDVDVKNLMPNSILTSPLFDIGTITSKAQEDHKKVRIEDKWREIKFNDKVQERLSSIYSKLKKDAEN